MIDLPFDFPMTEPSIWTSVYCVLGYLICFCWAWYKRNKFTVKKDNDKSRGKSVEYLVFVGLFLITNCLNGDFFHFMDSVHNYIYVDGFYNYGEPIYQIIGQFVSSNYLLFRFVVWGGAFLAFVITAYRMKLPVAFAAAILCMCFSVTFCYGRVTAAMALYFCGLSFLCTPTRYSAVGYVIGIVLICFSWSFHTSALIMILMSFMLFMPVKKWSVGLVVIATPIIAAFMKDLFFMYMLDEATDEFMADKLLRYSELEMVSGFARTIINFINYTSFIVPTYISYKTIFVKKQIHKIDKGIIRLFKVSFGLTYVAISFLLFGETFFTFFYRILNMTMIPITIIITKLYCDGNMSRRQFILAIIPGITYQFAHYAYMTYLNIL